jgi:hypothetical protein
MNEQQINEQPKRVPQPDDNIMVRLTNGEYVVMKRFEVEALLNSK